MLTVDLGAIAANTRRLLARTDAALIAVVKADGFGHGAAEVARTALASGASWLGVTGVEEALELRGAGIDAPILSWLNAIDADLRLALCAGVDVAVPSLAHLDAVARSARGCSPRGQAVEPARIHLHLDTGMARDGADPTTWRDLCREARRAERAGLVEVVGVMGHLGCADHPDDPHNTTGRTRFAWGVAVAESLGLRPRLRHLAATAATLTDPRTHHTHVRVGAGLVGIDPSGTTPLRGAMTLEAPVVSVREVAAGAVVGYGHAWTAPAPTRLGLVPLGYADGLPRAASGHAEVLAGGRRCAVVGRVSMDQVVVDLGTVGVGAGDTVTVFGPGDRGEPTVADWARWSGTIEHEVVTGIGRRVRRVHVRPPGGEAA